MPTLAAVGRAEQRGVFHARINHIRVVQRRLNVPNALEFPWMLRAVVPLMRRDWLAGLRRDVIHEFIALTFGPALRCLELVGAAARREPGFAAVVGPLDHLAEPTAGLRGVQPIRVSRRPLHVVNLPPAKERLADLPFLAFAVARKDKRTFFRADQDANGGHIGTPLHFSVMR